MPIAKVDGNIPFLFTDKKILNLREYYIYKYAQKDHLPHRSGKALAHIVKAYPHIHGINFDLPHVVQTAPSILGIESVGGSMFDSIPSADAIFVKNVFKDWDEEKCEQILGNCHKALPEMENSYGGKERSEKEWKRLLQKSSFSVVKMVEPPGPLSKLKIIEAIKV
ncbi:hypothetical protein SUGI_0354910 [Cryptomeria japonica]|nr:hypothetical protein SUGI_0354910 [Cryptomeria japonica]